jgi:hypothetical protein
MTRKVDVYHHAIRLMLISSSPESADRYEAETHQERSKKGCRIGCAAKGLCAMTANTGTCSTLFVVPSNRPDPVRARVTSGQQVVYSQILQMGSSHHAGIHTADRDLQLPPDTRNGGPRRPHPGDVLYWVACLGGVCLLLLCATT